MIYEKDNVYYMNKGTAFYVVDILVKEHTIVIMSTSKSVSVLQGATEYTYNELKNKFIKRTKTLS